MPIYPPSLRPWRSCAAERQSSFSTFSAVSAGLFIYWFRVMKNWANQSINVSLKRIYVVQCRELIAGCINNPYAIAHAWAAFTLIRLTQRLSRVGCPPVLRLWLPEITWRSVNNNVYWLGDKNKIFFLFICRHAHIKCTCNIYTVSVNDSALIGSVD